jgi:hypothetical protein
MPEEQAVVSARATEREESGKAARQGAAGAGGANAQPSGGDGGPKGQPAHARVGRRV